MSEQDPTVVLPEPGEYVTRDQFYRTLLRVGIGFGLLLAVTLAGIVAIALAVNNVQQDEIAHNHDRTSHEAAVNRRQARLIKELREITHPTKAQADRQLREGIKRCLTIPRCRRIFPNLARSAQAQREAQRRKHANTDLARSPGTASTPLRAPQSGGSSPTRPGRRPDHRPSRSPSAPERPPPGPPSSGPSSSPPPRPRPTVDVTAPLPAQICADGLLGINC